MLKKGNKVVINDGSYSKSIVGGKLVHESKSWHGEQFVIIETDCKFPACARQTWPLSSFNNTVIQAIDSGKVVFIEERFLRLVEPTHKVMVDMRQDGGWLKGEIVEISDRLYKEIKKS